MKQMLQFLLRRRDLRLLLPATAVSAFGDDLAVVVLTLRLYGETHSAWSITGLYLCSAVPVVALARAAGELVDRLPFRRLAVTAALWQACCCAALAVATPLWATYLLVLCLQTAQVAAGPTWQALLATIAEDGIGQAVGASQALNRLAAVAAPATAGVLVGSLGYGTPLLVDGATFLALAAAALLIRTSRGGASGAAAATPAAGAFSLRADTLLFPLVVAVCLLVLTGEATNVVEVFLVRGSLGAGPTAYGLLGGLLAAALVAGSLAAARPVPAARRALRTLAAAFVLALALVAGGLAPGIWVFAAAWAVLGVTNGILNTDVNTLVLERTPDAVRGRVLARINAMVRTASLVALGLGGLAGTLLGPRTTFVAAGGLMAATAVALLAQKLLRDRVEHLAGRAGDRRRGARVVVGATAVDERDPAA